MLNLNCHYDHLRKVAYGYIEYDNYLKDDENVANRILTISDLHVPYQLPIETFSDYINRIDILVLNGDLFDMQSISKFPKIYRVSPMEEIIIGREYLIELIAFINPKKVVINYGNHDYRFQSYLTRNLDADLLELLPETPIELVFIDGFKHYDKKLKAKIEYEPIADIFDDINFIYSYDWKCKIGKTWFVHPVAYSSGALKTTEKAMDYFHRIDKELFDSVIMAHTHSVAYEKIGYINLYEQGACCDVSQMTYNDSKMARPQKKGFMYICQDKDGNLIESKTKQIRLN